MSAVDRVAICVLIGRSSSSIMSLAPMEVASFRADGFRKAADNPDIADLSKFGNCIPPAGNETPRGSGLKSSGDE